MQPDDPSDPPTIKITIETKRVVEAEDAAHILEEVAKGFARYARGTAQRQLRLGIRRISHGSLVIDLAVVSPGGRVVPDPQPAARGFLLHLAGLVERGPAASSRRADQRLLDALLRPIAAGYATGVSLGIGGEANLIAMDASTAARIAPVAEATYDAVAPRRSTPARIATGAVAARPQRLDGGMGTAFDVKGRWYVQLEGEEGVLNPLVLDDGVFVEDGSVYRFDGVWEGRRYRIRGAVRIG